MFIRSAGSLEMSSFRLPVRRNPADVKKRQHLGADASWFYHR